MTVKQSIIAYFAELDKLAAGAVPELDGAICKTMNLERMSLATRAARADASPTAENLDAVAEGFAALCALVEGVRHQTTGEPDASFAALNVAAANVLHAGQVARRDIARNFARSQIAAARANVGRA